jgi:hypothetical protein
LLEPELGQLEGQGDPLVGQAAELLESGDLGFDLGEVRTPNELSSAFASVNPTELVVRAVALGVFGVLAPTAGLAADIVLLGEAAGTHVCEAGELVFDGLDLSLELGNRSGSFHIRYYI